MDDMTDQEKGAQELQQDDEDVEMVTVAQFNISEDNETAAVRFLRGDGGGQQQVSQMEYEAPNVTFEMIIENQKTVSLMMRDEDVTAEKEGEDNE